MVMGNDRWDEGGDAFVDFSGDAKARKIFKTRSQLTEYADIDLASGFPAKQIWTTKDGRRIAIPNMSDSHLNNTIAFLRRNASKYRTNLVKQLAAHLAELSLVGMLFENAPFHGDEEFDAAYEQIKARGHAIFNMSDEEILRKYVPQYSFLYQEAYKRKILLEVDATKIAPPKEIARRIRKKPVKKPEPTFEEAVEQWAEAARDTDGCEVPEPYWKEAQEVVKRWPEEFGLGSARGPDKYWKRLFLHSGSGNT